jgi:putative transposase
MRIARQCDLVGLPRSTYHYQSCGESAENLTLMRLLDRQYTDTPYYGVRRMTAWLRSQGYHVNHKRVARLMHTMGIEAIYPKPRLSQTHPTHRVYPYLLRGVPIRRVNQVWSTDITYIRLHGGFRSRRKITFPDLCWCCTLLCQRAPCLAWECLASLVRGRFPILSDPLAL